MTALPIESVSILAEMAHVTQAILGLFGLTVGIFVYVSIAFRMSVRWRRLSASYPSESDTSNAIATKCYESVCLFDGISQRYPIE